MRAVRLRRIFSGKSEVAVVDAMERLTQDRTTVFITHHLYQAARADLVVCMDQGRIIELGTHEELLKLSGQYAGLWGLQVKSYLPTAELSDADSQLPLQTGA